MILFGTAAVSLAAPYTVKVPVIGLKPSTTEAVTPPVKPVTPFAFNLGSVVGTTNLRAAALNAGWDGNSPLTATLPSGGVLAASTSSAYALVISGSFPQGLVFVNKGGIYGAGGKGGDGGSAISTVTAGEPGGPALSVSSAVTFSNLGVIAGGGGAGGSSGTTWDGGGGGGGAGYVPGAAGYGKDYTPQAGSLIKGGDGRMSKGNTAGGVGGNAGVQGNAGGSTTSALGGGGGGGLGSAGGNGGASSATSKFGGVAGAAVTGNSNITWETSGQLYGPKN